MIDAPNDKNAPSPRGLLMVATENWPMPGQIARHLERAGFAVAAISPRHSPLRFSAAVSRWFPLSPVRPRASLVQAIDAWTPLAIVPCDDDALAQLHAVHRRCAASGAVARRIEQSLGDPDGFDLVRTKSKVTQMAERLGIPTPRCDVVHSHDEILRYERGVFPKVLKKDFTFGGRGVVIARDFGSLVAGYAALNRRQKVSTALWDCYVEQTLRPLVRRHAGIAPATVVQDYVSGNPANTALFAQGGEVIGAVTAIARQTHPGATGPATLVELREIPAIDAAARTLCRALKLSGFCGLDFVHDADSGAVHFLEINARLTPIAHLGRQRDTSLPAAAARQLLRRCPDLRYGLDPQVVALFPQEWLRDAASPHLGAADHDVPWDDPPAVHAMVRWAQRTRRTERLFRQLKRLRLVWSQAGRLRPV